MACLRCSWLWLHLVEYALRSLDIAGLRPFVAASEHDHEDVPTAGEVQAIYGTKVHPHFIHLAADWFPVPKVSCFRMPQARRNTNLAALIGQCIKPILEFLGELNREALGTVSKWIQAVKGVSS